MYRIYVTNACVIGYHNRNEADRVFDLFTEEYGYIRAIAKSVRLEKSKLRYALADFSISRISLVRGKDMWRLIQAEPRDAVRGVSVEGREQHDQIQTIARAAQLLKRLMPPETVDIHLYNTWVNFIQVVRNTSDRDYLHWYEIAMVLTTLNSLGYVGDITEWAGVFEQSVLFSEAQRPAMQQRARMAIQTINHALHHSHL